MELRSLRVEPAEWLEEDTVCWSFIYTKGQQAPRALCTPSTWPNKQMCHDGQDKV